jgi:hypothetical protein
MSTLLRNANDPAGPLAAIDIDRSAWLQVGSSPMTFTCTPVVAVVTAANCALIQPGDPCDHSDENDQSTVVG